MSDINVPQDFKYVIFGSTLIPLTFTLKNYFVLSRDQDCDHGMGLSSMMNRSVAKIKGKDVIRRGCF